MAHRFYADAVDDVDAFLILYALSTEPNQTTSHIRYSLSFGEDDDSRSGSGGVGDEEHE